jgi:hypothetical protein
MDKENGTYKDQAGAAAGIYTKKLFININGCPLQQPFIKSLFAISAARTFCTTGTSLTYTNIT